MRNQYLTSIIQRQETIPGNTNHLRHLKYKRIANKYKRRERLGRAVSTVCPRMFSAGVFVTEFVFHPRGASAVLALGMILVLVAVGIVAFILEELREERLYKLRNQLSGRNYVD